MMDKRSKLIVIILIILIINIAVVGYFTSINFMGDNSYLNIIPSEYNKLDLFSKNENNETQIAYDSDVSMTVKGDLITLDYGPAASFSVNTVNNYNSAKNITAYGGVKSGRTGYVSLPNGTYYLYGQNINGAKIAKGPVYIKNSCTDQTVPTNQTGTFSVERCYFRYPSSVTPPSIANAINTKPCASGYSMSYSVNTSDCTAKNDMYGMARRYCKGIVTITCTKNGGSGGGGGGGGSNPSVPAATLTSLSVNSGSLSPAFKSSTKTYSVTVDSNVSSIQVFADVSSGGSFVAGSGPRTVNLNYGNNAIKIRVKNSAGAQTTYTINVNRPDGRSSVNTLSNLKSNVGELSPAFTSDNFNYTIDVPNHITAITLDATLTDNSSSFVAGFGPSTYALELGPNKIYVKVASQRGDVNVYNITVNRETTPSECTTETDELALLKGIQLSVDIPGIELDQIEDFDPQTFTYDIKVPNQVSSLEILPLVQEDGDTYEIEGNEDFEVGESRAIVITIKSTKCPNYSNVYTINVERQPEEVLGTDPSLRTLVIKNHDEFKYEPNQLNYSLVLHKGEDKLEFEQPFNTVEKNTQCEVIGNENLTIGSTVSVRCTPEDREQDSVTYSVTIDGVEKGTNIIIIIILVIFIILLLIYVVLRLLGYRIYFNFAVIGAFFRGIGEKFNNMFDK